MCWCERDHHWQALPGIRGQQVLEGVFEDEGDAGSRNRPSDVFVFPPHVVVLLDQGRAVLGFDAVPVENRTPSKLLFEQMGEQTKGTNSDVSISGPSLSWPFAQPSPCPPRSLRVECRSFHPGPAMLTVRCCSHPTRPVPRWISQALSSTDLKHGVLAFRSADRIITIVPADQSRELFYFIHRCAWLLSCP